MNTKLPPCAQSLSFSVVFGRTLVGDASAPVVAAPHVQVPRFTPMVVLMTGSAGVSGRRLMGCLVSGEPAFGWVDVEHLCDDTEALSFPSAAMESFMAWLNRPPLPEPEIGPALRSRVQSGDVRSQPGH